MQKHNSKIKKISVSIFMILAVLSISCISIYADAPATSNGTVNGTAMYPQDEDAVDYMWQCALAMKGLGVLRPASGSTTLACMYRQPNPNPSQTGKYNYVLLITISTSEKYLAYENGLVIPKLSTGAENYSNCFVFLFDSSRAGGWRYFGTYNQTNSNGIRNYDALYYTTERTTISPTKVNNGAPESATYEAAYGNDSYYDGGDSYNVAQSWIDAWNVKKEGLPEGSGGGFTQTDLDQAYSRGQNAGRNDVILEPNQYGLVEASVYQAYVQSHSYTNQQYTDYGIQQYGSINTTTGAGTGGMKAGWDKHVQKVLESGGAEGDNVTLDIPGIITSVPEATLGFFNGLTHVENSQGQKVPLEIFGINVQGLLSTILIVGIVVAAVALITKGKAK